MTTTLELHTLREGYGLPLVLLHAFPLDHRMWIDVTTAMTGPHRVLAVDLPGLGQSKVPTAEPSLDVSADAVIATLAKEGISRAVFAGLSMGGYVALAILDRHPETVAALGLIDTKSTADPEEAKQSRLRMADRLLSEQTLNAVLPMAGALLGETSQRTRKELTPRIEEWIRSQRPAGVAWSQRAMAARPDRTAVLASFSAPATILVGDEDTATPVTEAEHMVVAARHATLQVIEGAGHLSAVENPEPVAIALRDLLHAAQG